jgi:hypothetical protein
VFSEFRARLMAGDAAERLLRRMLQAVALRHPIPASTHTWSVIGDLPSLVGNRHN